VEQVRDIMDHGFSVPRGGLTGDLDGNGVVNIWDLLRVNTLNELVLVGRNLGLST